RMVVGLARSPLDADLVPRPDARIRERRSPPSREGFETVKVPTSTRLPSPYDCVVSLGRCTCGPARAASRSPTCYRSTAWWNIPRRRTPDRSDTSDSPGEARGRGLRGTQTPVPSHAPRLPNDPSPRVSRYSNHEARRFVPEHRLEDRR